MSKQKAFNTPPFNGFKAAIYEMHRTLVHIKQIFDARQDSEEATQEVAKAYADKMEAALKRAGEYGQEWLAEIRKGSPG